MFVGASGVAATWAGDSPNSLKKPSCNARSTRRAPAACSLNITIQSSSGARAAARPKSRQYSIRKR